MHTKKSKVATTKSKTAASKTAAPKKVATKKAPVKAKALASTAVAAPITWFTASWCSPCQMIKKEYEKLSAEDKALFEIVDVDAQPERAAGIRSIPTFQVRGEGSLHGLQSLKTLIAQVKAV